MKSWMLPIIVSVLFSCQRHSNPNPSYYQQLVIWRADSLSWDHEMLETDARYFELLPMPVMESGVYGTPRYDLHRLAPFEGLETTYEELRTDSGIWVSNYFFSKNEKEKAPFFSISFLMQQIDTVAFDHNQRVVISRNFPDYLCQGFFQENKRKVEYIAFQTYDGDFYALVNSRIFRGSKLRGRFVGDRLEVVEE